MKRPRTKTKKRNNRAHVIVQPQVRLPFIEHLLELRRRLFYVALSIIIWSSAAYAVEHTIVRLLLAPANGQKFVYTTVGGGIDFLFRVCLYTGIVLSVPVIIYQILRYVEPLIGKHSSRFIVLASITSGILAIAGVLFGYFLGLPAALQFLLNQFHSSEISALITIQAYLSFVILYLAGSALMFQVPLIIFIINRIKPIKLRTLFKYERWVILISFIVAAAINPSPRIYDMTILAVPMIMSYQVGIALVWYTNSHSKQNPKIQALLARDAALREERQSRLKNAVTAPPVKTVKTATSKPKRRVI